MTSTISCSRVGLAALDSPDPRSLDEPSPRYRILRWPKSPQSCSNWRLWWDCMEQRAPECRLTPGRDPQALGSQTSLAGSPGTNLIWSLNRRLEWSLRRGAFKWTGRRSRHRFGILQVGQTRTGLQGCSVTEAGFLGQERYRAITSA